MRLATVQKITGIKPIEGADKIELAFVLGWQVVIKKGEFKIGDNICYIQIDTVVPEKPEYEFLRPRNFRIRTIKLKQELSQGLIVPVPSGKWSEGDDLTEVMGIKKYEKPDNNPSRYEKPRVPKVWYKKYIYLFKYNILYKFLPSLRPKDRSPFPKHIVSITDEERIQNIPNVLQQYKGKRFVVSYKLDGSSITIIHSKFLFKSRFRICSRRFELHDKKNDWYKVFKDAGFENHIKKLVKHYGTNDIVVQGEAVGKFNGNHHGLKKDEIRLFNIYVDGKRISQLDLIIKCRVLNIPYCPEYSKLTTVLDHSLEDILKASEIKDILNPNVEAEGLVWRCVEDNMSFKVINNNYLLKNKQ